MNKISRNLVLGVAILSTIVIAILSTLGLRLEAFSLRNFDRKAAIEAAAAYQPTIYRDEWGVPRITGDTDPGLAFGFAFAHAEDDFATIQEGLRLSLGPDMLARSESEAQIAYLIQALDIISLSRTGYETQLKPDTRAFLDGYAAGLNYFAALNPDEYDRDLFPVSGQDVAALAAFSSPLFFGMSRTITNIVSPDTERSISEGQSLQVWYDAVAEIEMGSNAFAVAPTRSDDGATRLIVNSHQPLEGPLAWYEAHYISNNGWEFTGGAFPGGPFIHLGANQNMAQAATVNSPDLIDVYKLLLNEDQDRYLLDGVSREFETSTATILFDLPGPFAWRLKQPIERSDHGPVLRAPGGDAYAIRYATQGSLKAIDQTFDMMRAQSVSEYEDIMARGDLGATNRFVSDTSGRIARFYNARMPKRLDEPNLDWEEYLPGDRSDLIWDAFEPFDRRPHMIDPAAGYVLDANSSPFQITLGLDDPKAEDFPVTFGIETLMTNRALRATTLFAQDEDGFTSREELIAIKHDGTYHPDSLALQLRSQLLAMNFENEPQLAKGLSVIEAWDGATNLDNPYTALSIATYQPIGVAFFLGQTPPPLEQSYRDAYAYMMKHHGKLDPLWGDVNRHQRGGVDLSIAGGPDTLRAVNSSPNGKGALVMNSGDGLHYLWESYPDGRVELWGVHQFGSSNREESQHYTNQMELFVNEKYRRIPLGVEAVKTAATETYTPGYRSKGL